MSKYHVNGLPWHSGIGTNVASCITSQEVMQASGLDFTVKKCNLVAEMPFRINENIKVDTLAGDFVNDGYVYKDCPNAYGTYRTDLSYPLGLVKEKYQVVQNVDAFKFFDTAIGDGKARWDRAGMFGNGHKIFVSAKLPIGTKVGNDDIDHYLVFSNSHDGSSSINILFTPIRVICTNMLNSAIDSADSYIRIRHTKTAKEKLEFGAEVLRASIEHAKTATELYNSLLKIKMSDKDVIRYLADLQLKDTEREALLAYDKENGYKKLLQRDYYTIEKTGISQRKVNQINNMVEYYFDGIGQQHIAGTAWGAYNAVTGFYCNVANLEKEKRVDSILYGGANRNMNKALVRAIEYAY